LNGGWTIADTLKFEQQEQSLMDLPERGSSEQESKEDLKGLYDLAIPLGMPVTVIGELVEKFDLDVVRRKGKMDMTGEVMDREILVLRGDLETVMAAKNYMFEALDRKIEEWDKKDKEQKYKRFYEERVAEKMEEIKKMPKDQKWDTTF
jgi:hypothetical protein